MTDELWQEVGDRSSCHRIPFRLWRSRPNGRRAPNGGCIVDMVRTVKLVYGQSLSAFSAIDIVTILTLARQLLQLVVVGGKLMKSMNVLRFAGMIFSVLIGYGSAANAVPISFTETTIGSGYLNGTFFTNAGVQFAFQGDTSNAFLAINNIYELPVTGGFTVTGVGSDSFFNFPGNQVMAFVTQDFFGSNTTALAGFELDSGGSFTNIFGIRDAAFSTYDLTSAISVTGAGFPHSNAFFGTASGGAFNLSSAGDTTFIATLGVPEPASLSILGAGLAGAVAMRRRRKTAKVA